MQTRRLAMVVLAVALGTGACAGRQKPSLGKPQPPAVVRVANNNFADINIYVVQSGMRLRLGTVSGLSEGQFTLPRRFAAYTMELHLLADPIGGSRAYMSPALRVRGGEEVDLRLHATLSMSSVSVWGP
jgi:hypothetical protein